MGCCAILPCHTTQIVVKKRGRLKAASHEGNQLPSAVRATFALSHELGAFGLLFLVALLLRLPFVFPAVIDWDESTFVLVGQSWLQGDLPYVELWALKPPLAFAFYAVVIAIFGKDLVAVRLAGTLCVVVSAFLIYLTASRLWNRRVGLVAAILCVATVSLLPSGQATMSEHVTLVPLTLALWLLVRNEPSVRYVFYRGSPALRRDARAAEYCLRSRLRRPVSGHRSDRAQSCQGGPVCGGVRGRRWAGRCIDMAALLSDWRARGLVDSVVVCTVELRGLEIIRIRKSESLFKSRFQGSLLIAFVSLGTAGGVAVLGRRWGAHQTERRGIAMLVILMTGVGVGILTGGDPYVSSPDSTRTLCRAAYGDMCSIKFTGFHSAGIVAVHGGIDGGFHGIRYCRIRSRHVARLGTRSVALRGRV